MTAQMMMMIISSMTIATTIPAMAPGGRACIEVEEEGSVLGITVPA